MAKSTELKFSNLVVAVILPRPSCFSCSVSFPFETSFERILSRFYFFSKKLRFAVQYLFVEKDFFNTKRIELIPKNASCF